MPSDPTVAVAEMAARARAARGYSGLSQKALAAALDYSVETVSRMENGRRTIEGSEARRIAEICHVPLPFMEHGFELITTAAGAPAAGDVLSRLDSLEATVRQLVTRDAAREMEARRPPAEAHEPTSHPPQSQPPPGAPGERAPSDGDDSQRASDAA